MGTALSAAMAMVMRPRLPSRGFPGLHALQAEERPRGDDECADDDKGDADPRQRRGRRNHPRHEREAECVLQKDRWTQERDGADACRSIAARDHQFLQRHDRRIREQDAHARRGRRGNAAPDEEHADQRADGNARDENARRPQ